MPTTLIVGSVIIALVAIIGFAIRKKYKSSPKKQKVAHDPFVWGAEGFVPTTQCLQTSVWHKKESRPRGGFCIF